MKEIWVVILMLKIINLLIYNNKENIKYISLWIINFKKNKK